MQSSREATPTLMVQTITTDIRRDVEDPRYKEILICFYPATRDGDVAELFIVTPAWWTPQMFLGALNFSLSQHYIISMEPITIDSKRYTSSNEIHWLYSSDRLSPDCTEGLFKML